MTQNINDRWLKEALMGILTMVEIGACRDDLVELPLFYMNDFSVMGLVVPRLASAVRALEASGFNIESASSVARIRFVGSGQLTRVFEALASAKIPFDMTDLMDQAYQG